MSAKKLNRALKIGFENKTIGSTSVMVETYDAGGNITKAYGSSVPASLAGFAKGGLFVKLGVSDGSKALYENVGSSSSSNFNLIGDVTAGEITLAEGNLLVGNSSGVAAALSAKTSNQILVGNGTTLASVAVSGDLTNSAGAFTIGSGAVTGAKASTAMKTKVMTCPAFIKAPTGSDQNDQGAYLFIAPAAMTITSLRLISGTATSGSDATNHYLFNVRNTTTGVNLGSTDSTTNGAELASEVPKTLVADQNLTLAANDGVILRYSIKDDGGAGPTSLSSAVVRVAIGYTISA